MENGSEFLLIDQFANFLITLIKLFVLIKNR